MNGTVEAWQCGHVSQVFEAVSPCFTDSYGGLKIHQDIFSKTSSVRRLQPQGMKKETP